MATIHHALAWSIPLIRHLSPRFGAEVLLAHVLGRRREDVLAHPEAELSAEQAAAYRALVERCAAGEPLFYLLGRREFYGRDFEIDARVLIPRPESEHLVEAVLAWARGRAALTLVDVGTGSGALAVTLALELPAARVYATDVSEGALAVAGANAGRLGARVALCCADLLAPLRGPFDALVANLPYVSRDEQGALDAEPNVVAHEPHVALDGGEDGLTLVRRFLEQAPERLRPGGAVFMEIGAGQAQAVCALAAAAFPRARVATVRDLGGHERVVTIDD